MSELRFDGRVVVVTGAGSGLGREYALLFASRGAKVVVNDLGGDFHGGGNSQRAADVVVDEIKSKGGSAVANYNSVTDGDKIIETAISNFQRIDVLVNNAGILRDKSFAKMTDQDWNLIQDVHVKGSVKTTQAAWPYFRKQNYGRIIMTSSNSGIFGNFGQANYSAAKLALVGLANTLAIEGAKYNIYCNVIVPTAASRMTEGILPDILFQELKPKLIAPVVVYLCHESNTDNGAIIESAAGWASKIHFVRGKGTLLRTSIENDNITPEYVASVWNRVVDMSGAEHLDSIAEASGTLVEVLENLKNNTQTSAGSELEDEFQFGNKDLILYALGVGATVRTPGDLQFLYEGHPDFQPIPSFFVIPGLLHTMSTGLVASAIKHTSVDLTNIRHGEQYIEICGALPVCGKLKSRGEVIDVMDKKSGAVAVINCDSFDENGNLVVKNQSSIFIVGAGNFGGKKEPATGVIPLAQPPQRSPDSVIDYTTSVDQAALYRLSGDSNPLHIDPNFSIVAGFEIPILHGLCSLGYSVRAVLTRYANNDSSLFKSVKVRFSNPVIPGQTLRTSMWREGTRIYFKTTVLENKKDVITGAYVDLKDVVDGGKHHKL